MVQRPPVGWRDYDSPEWGGVKWSPWMNLDADTLATAPDAPGLYRVRHQNREGLSYVGESGDTEHRIRALARRVPDSEMPFRDPHTAAPCLWAIRDDDGPGFELSYTTPDCAADDQQRKGLEAALIASYRLETGESPPANFGRIIPGYQQSTYRNGGVRGGRLADGENEPNAERGCPPKTWVNFEAVTDRNWMGSDWSDPYRLADRLDADPPDVGLYRIWYEGDVPPLAYIGESSNIGRRLYKHEDTYGGDALFSYAPRTDLDASHKRGEAECDLIGAHYIAHGCPPRTQFGFTDQIEIS